MHIFGGYLSLQRQDNFMRQPLYEHSTEYAPKQSRTDAYGNFPLVFEPIRKLVHASREAIEFYKKVCNLNKKQMTKPNDLYYMANLKTIPKQIL